MVSGNLDGFAILPTARFWKVFNLSALSMSNAYKRMEKTMPSLDTIIMIYPVNPGHNEIGITSTTMGIDKDMDCQ